MKTITQLVTAVSCLLTFSGCSSDNPLDVGDDRTGTSAQGLAAYEGAWDGYAEAQKFPSGSDRVRLTLDAEGEGTLEVGDAPHFTCTDSSIGCPSTGFRSNEDNYRYFDAQEGHEYAVSAHLENDRLQLTFRGNDAQKAWCETQTPELTESTPITYSCSPLAHSFGHDGNGGCFAGANQDIPIDCSFGDTGMTACDCTVDACTSRSAPELQLDGALEDDGDSFVGTLKLEEARVTVRMKKP